MPGGEANVIFYLVDQGGLEGATATSGDLACDVCFQDAEKLISTAEIGAKRSSSKSCHSVEDKNAIGEELHDLLNRHWRTCEPLFKLLINNDNGGPGGRTKTFDSISFFVGKNHKPSRIVPYAPRPMFGQSAGARHSRFFLSVLFQEAS